VSGITTKQAAAKVRVHLNKAAEAANRGGHIRFGDRYELRLPRGLRFNVRASKSGVNVQIEEGYGPSYIDDVTGGDREAFDREHADAVVRLIEEYERQVWGRLLGKVEWGVIVISTRVTGTTEIAPFGAGDTGDAA
jgi:hypothetical protein